MRGDFSQYNYPPGFDPKVLDNEDEILIPEIFDEDDDSSGIEDEYVL